MYNNGYYVYVYHSDRNPLKRAQTQTYSKTDGYKNPKSAGPQAYKITSTNTSIDTNTGASEMLMNEEIEQDYHRISLL